MAHAGLVDEVEALRRRPRGLSRTAAQAIGYQEVLAHLAGECSLDEALAATATRTRQFARRQRMWFRRDPRISWVAHAGDAAREPGRAHPRSPGRVGAMTAAHLSKLHATGNDFLVWSWLGTDGSSCSSGSIGSEQARAAATATGASAPTGSSS